jgi:hypothetical protein
VSAPVPAPEYDPPAILSRDAIGMPLVGGVASNQDV